MAKDSKRFSNDVQIRNRKAGFEYELIEKFEAGLVLKGTEIKSIREGKASVQEAYCYLRDNEAFVKGMNISPYTQASFASHEQARDRKLLLKKRELERLKSKTEEKGLTIVPLRIFINKRGFAKLEIALARGKKLFDKRDSIRKKDEDKELKKLKI